MLKRVLCLKEFIKLCADQITIYRSNSNLQTKPLSEDQKIVLFEDQRIICRLKNLVIKKSIQSEDWRIICRSKNCLQIIQRAICRLKNYLEIEELSANRRVWWSKKYSILRLKNYVKIGICPAHRLLTYG